MGLQSKIEKKLRPAALCTDRQTKDRKLAPPCETTISNTPPSAPANPYTGLRPGKGKMKGKGGGEQT